MSQAQPCIKYDPACVECRRDAGKDAAGTTWQCIGHAYLERDRLRAALAIAQAERDEARRNAERMRIAVDATADLLITASAERDAARQEAQQLRMAVGLLTTLHPTMEMDCEHPMEMAQQIERHVSAQLTKARRVLREVREWHRCPWQHGASVEVLDLTRHAEWIARIDAAVLAQEEK